MYLHKLNSLNIILNDLKKRYMFIKDKDENIYFNNLGKEKIKQFYIQMIISRYFFIQIRENIVHVIKFYMSMSIFLITQLR